MDPPRRCDNSVCLPGTLSSLTIYVALAAAHLLLDRIKLAWSTRLGSVRLRLTGLSNGK